MIVITNHRHLLPDILAHSRYIVEEEEEEEQARAAEQ